MLNTESTPYSSLGLSIIFVILKIMNKIFKYFSKKLQWIIDNIYNFEFNLEYNLEFP
jgi:hypothetical protein